MTSSKLISGDSLTGDVLTWNAPEVHGRPAGGAFGSGGIDELDPEAAHREARDAGFKEGHAAGFDAGRQAMMEKTAALENMLGALARPLGELDHRVEEEILALVQTIVRQVVRREVNLDPSHLAGAIREGISALPLSSEDIVVRLHPADAEVARECLPPGDEDRAWKIEIDPVIQRGGCLIITSTSQVDERLETRIGRAIATMFEDERSNDE